jgi:hypothetical protein
MQPNMSFVRSARSLASTGYPWFIRTTVKQAICERQKKHGAWPMLDLY